MESPLLSELKLRMEKALEGLKEENASVRTGRATTGLLEHIQVTIYGSRMPLNQLASLSIPEPRVILVQPWDKGSIQAIDKAIRESDLGLNPINDGKLLRVPMPELTEQRRKELVKLIHKYGEASKIAMRNVRREGIEQLRKSEKNKAISKDDLFSLEKQVQEITDSYIGKVDHSVSQKEADIMQV